MADPVALPILVTGGAGFIGSNFVRQWLAEESSPIVNLDKLTYAGNLDSLADLAADRRYRLVHGDICDRRLVSELLGEVRPRAIVHFAAESHVDRSIDEAAAFLETNVVGTFRLLDAALGYWESTGRAAMFRFIQVSTDEVFGSLGPEGRFVETSPYAPNSPYSASKAAADQFARAYHRTYGLPVIVTRCANNYGPRQFPEKLVPLMILNALEGRPLPVYGDGRNVRDWIHVDDHCRAIRCVLERGGPGETYNIGADCQRTNLEVVETICDLVDRLQPQPAGGSCRRLIEFVRDRPGHDRRYAIDAAKIRRELGWAPREDFETGIERTVKWYMEHTEWVDGVRSGRYRQRQGLRDQGPALSG